MNYVALFKKLGRKSLKSKLGIKLEWGVCVILVLNAKLAKMGMNNSVKKMDGVMFIMILRDMVISEEIQKFKL